MSQELFSEVRLQLIPRVCAFGFDIVEHEESDSFDNSSVVLQGHDLRLRIVRERSQVFADVGSTTEPHAWFDSAVVMDYLGLSEHGGFHGRDAAVVLEGLANFLNAFRVELTEKFSNARFAHTKRELVALSEARAEKELARGRRFLP